MQGVQPKPIGGYIIPYGTPLHVRDLVITLLRWQFQNFPETFPYRYLPDDYENTHITFDTVYNKDSENYGKKPLVVVTRETQTTNPVVLGDLADKVPRVSSARGSTLVYSSIAAKVLSKIYLEAEIIGQTIFGIFLSYRTILPSVLGIQDIANVSLSSTTRFDQDDAMFVCQVDMAYCMQYKWTSDADNPLIEGIKVYKNLLEDKQI